MASSTARRTTSPDADGIGIHPVVVANILAGALVALEAVLAAACARGGRIALSGILRGQAEEVLAAYAPDFDELAVETLEDWVRITGRRMP